MSRGREAFTKEERGVIEIYGHVVKSDHDWHDTDYLERLILSKYDRETATKALVGLLEKSGALHKDRGRNLESPGGMMEAFIQTRADRFTWQPGDLVLVGVTCPHCNKMIECRQEKPEICPRCHKKIEKG